MKVTADDLRLALDKKQEQINKVDELLVLIVDDISKILGRQREKALALLKLEESVLYLKASIERTPLTDYIDVMKEANEPIQD